MIQMQHRVCQMCIALFGEFEWASGLHYSVLQVNLPLGYAV